jgi:hypothetical protein
MLDDQKISIAIFSVCQYGLAIYIKENLEAKKELSKFQYFNMQKYNLKKKILLNKLNSFKISQLYH